MPTDDEILTALRLNLIPGVGPRTQQSLLEYFGSPASVFAASRGVLLEVEGIGPKLATAIIAAASSGEAERELERCRSLGVELILREDARYPAVLKQISDPPSVLYCRGTLEPRDQLAIGIVGSRRCTAYGRRQAEKMGAALARAGVTVVSGLARGIDAAAHHGALQAGRTLAVLGTGVEHIYPPEHFDLAGRVAQQGAILSECALDQAPLPGLFPQRNRIISGLSLAVLVIEATRNSGALHTVRHALEQGRDVFAVPGPVDSLASEGCHDIIRDGATLVRNVDDILSVLGPMVNPVTTAPGESVHSARELTLDPQERQILNLITTEPVTVDFVLQQSPLETSRVLSTITILEMKRFIRRLPGGQLSRQ